jgi:hypothetical protein
MIRTSDSIENDDQNLILRPRLAQLLAPNSQAESKELCQMLQKQEK